MINHISIGVHNPEKVANVLAELWNGYAFPFPVADDSFIVFADDEKGTVVEVTPNNTVIVPGKGLPDDTDFSLKTLTETEEAKFVKSEFSPQFVATHLNINSPLSIEEIKAIGEREGWRVLTCNREKGLFQLVELWIENRFMLEVMTPEMTARYVELVKPQNWADFLQMPLPPKPVLPTNLHLVG